MSIRINLLKVRVCLFTDKSFRLFLDFPPVLSSSFSANLDGQIYQWDSNKAQKYNGIDSVFE